MGLSSIIAGWCSIEDMISSFFAQVNNPPPGHNLSIQPDLASWSLTALRWRLLRIVLILRRLLPWIRIMWKWRGKKCLLYSKVSRLWLEWSLFPHNIINCALYYLVCPFKLKLKVLKIFACEENFIISSVHFLDFFGDLIQELQKI